MFDYVLRRSKGMHCIEFIGANPHQIKGEKEIDTNMCWISFDDVWCELTPHDCRVLGEALISLGNGNESPYHEHPTLLVNYHDRTGAY